MKNPKDFLYVWKIFYIKKLLANNKIVYVKGMDVGFGGIPSNVDAAMVWPANNKIYFFKGN